MMTNTTKRSVSLLAAVLLAGIVSMGGATAQTTKVKFVLDWTWQAHHAIWTLAQDNGCFADEGLDVTIDRGFGSGDTVAKVAKVAAKTYDIGLPTATCC
jgi:NitT/TauT family transport system substrate-binding protein